MHAMMNTMLSTDSRFRPSSPRAPHVTTLPAAVLALLVGAFLLTGCGGSGGTPQDAAASQDEHTEEQHNQDEHAGEPSHTGEAEHAGEGEHAGEETHAGGGEHAVEVRAVELTPDQVQALGIRVDTLRAGSASSAISRPASVMFDLDRVANQGPRVEGKVRRVTVDLGDRVEAGQTLAIMSSVELGKAKAQYLTAKAHLNTRRRAYEREQQLYADSISSEAALLEAQAAFEEAQANLTSARETLRLYGLSEEEVESDDAHGEPLSHFHVRTPIAGIVQKRDASPGQTLSSQETPFHVADPSRMWVMIDAYERDAALLQSGQPVTLTVRSQPGRAFEGTVDFVSYQLDEETRTMRVRAVVDNADGQLRAGMYGQATIQTDATVERALVSTDAVQTIDGQPMVFVPGDQEGHFRAVRVQTGQESQSGFIEILDGLRPGERAVTQGAFDLKAALTSSTRSAAHSH
jgi:cobalt-zinc-cadmium efflux system membrane fusion protein